MSKNFSLEDGIKANQFIGATKWDSKFKIGLLFKDVHEFNCDVNNEDLFTFKANKHEVFRKEEYFGRKLKYDDVKGIDMVEYPELDINKIRLKRTHFNLAYINGLDYIIIRNSEDKNNHSYD